MSHQCYVLVGITISMLLHALCSNSIAGVCLLLVSVCYSSQLLRSLLMELTRIENHLLNVACHAGDVGCLIGLLCV